MPTTTIAGQLTLTNLGALTTTFTAPASCSTGWNLIRGAGNDGRPLQGPLVWPGTDCMSRSYSTASLDCLPHGDEVGSFLATHLELFEPTWGAMYYSPAYACPSGWETVGVADMNNGTPTISGPAFYPTGTATSRLPSGDFVPNMITSALGPQETAVFCCPSGFTIDRLGQDCKTQIPAGELESSTVCVALYTEFVSTVVPETTRTWEFDGQPMTETLVDFTYDGDSGHLATATGTFGPDGVPTISPNRNTTDERLIIDYLEGIVAPPGNPNSEMGKWTGFGIVPALVMINNGTDGEGEGGEGGGEDDSAAGSVGPASLWVVGGALLAGLITVAAV